MLIQEEGTATSMDHSPDGYGPWGTIYGVIAITNIVIGADHASLEGNPQRLITLLVKHMQSELYAILTCLEIMDNSL